jgi:phenylpropionate dioxygenase-like ring-hydroxylating dioxygenase large terminal subunit
MVNELRGWRPIFPSRRLRRRPVSVRLLDQDIVLFRSRGGVAAFFDRCPHRGMRLSRGQVRDDNLVCPYHGWSFYSDGTGRSPGNPDLKCNILAFNTAERYGLVWMAERGNHLPLPSFDGDGMSLLHQTSQLIRAPLESVLDNFTEVEHTGVSHWQFGYDPNQMSMVENVTKCTEDAVSVTAYGPQKQMLRICWLALGVRRGDYLHCDFETRFDPLRCVWNWYWQEPHTAAKRWRKFRAVAYFNQTSDSITQLITMYFWSRNIADVLGADKLLRPLMRLAINYEVLLDMNLVENLANNGTGIPPNGSSRFDKALIEQRRRIAPGVRP